MTLNPPKLVAISPDDIGIGLVALSIGPMSGYECLELVFLGAVFERKRRRCASRDHFGDCVEIAGAHFALMLGRRVAELLRCELCLLQLRVSRHPMITIIASELEHSVIQGVEAGEGDELELVAHRSK